MQAIFVGSQLAGVAQGLGGEQAPTLFGHSAACLDDPSGAIALLAAVRDDGCAIRGRVAFEHHVLARDTVPILCVYARDLCGVTRAAFCGAYLCGQGQRAKYEEQYSYECHLHADHLLRMLCDSAHFVFSSELWLGPYVRPHTLVRVAVELLHIHITWSVSVHRVQSCGESDVRACLRRLTAWHIRYAGWFGRASVRVTLLEMLQR